MPLTRYQIRNEYSLADPELYKAAERDDPEALLEGVAMAGLVGVLRQLGDLSEFAAEIFHDLHEEVMATAARGHGLIVRVQQLEAEIPSIEKAFLLQTNHTSFHSNAGIDWHPNLHMQQNLITRGDLPRCVMDSYEECRGPPRLFLLDKFDVAGAGACLKRYTDPSFFKVETAHSELSAEVRREKKFRKGKKKGSRWKNGETPEIVPTSHAKLHQLFLEESVDKGRSDPARLVKLKRRQLNASPFDSRSGKSYMEKLLETAPERNEVREISVSPLPLKLTSDNSSESGQEIYDITTVSPVKETLQGRDISCSSPNAHEVVEKPSINELYGEVIDRQIVKTPEPSAGSERDEIPSSHLTLIVDKEIQVDGEGKREGSVDGNNSEDMTSEVENYMDALTTIEPEMETDHEYRPKTDRRFLNVEKHAMDPDRNWEQLEFEAHSSDAQSIGNFSAYDDGNSSLKKGRSSFFYSDTLSNLADITPSDSEASAKVFSTSEASGSQSTEMPSNQLPADVAALRDKSRDLLLPNKMCVDEDNIHSHEGVSSNFSPLDSIYPLSPLEPATSSMLYQSAETPSELMIPSSGLSYRDEKETKLVDSLEVVSDLPSQTRDDTSFTASAESHYVNKLDGVDPRASSDDLLHSSNISELASENKSDNDSPDKELQIDFAGKSYPDCTLNTQIDSPWSSSLPKEDRVRFSDLSEVEDLVVEKHEDLSSQVVRDALSETAIDRENSTSIVETSKNCSYEEQRASDMENVSQAELESVEKTSVCSAEANLADTFGTADSEKIGASSCKVAAVDRKEFPLVISSNYTEGLLEDHAELDAVVAESIQAENMTFSATAADYVPCQANADDVDFVYTVQDLICSPSNDTLNSGTEDPRNEGLARNEPNSPECLEEPEAENETAQLGVAPNDFDPPSYNWTSSYESNSDMINGVHNSLAGEIINSLPAGNITRSSGFSDQELESEYVHQTHLMKGVEDALSSSAVFSDPESSIEHPLVLPADQLEDHLSEKIQSSSNKDQERLFYDLSLSRQEDHASVPLPSGYLQQSTGVELNNTIAEMDPLRSVIPSFGLLPGADQVNLEEMPPLPPLPPMQWRLGKIEHSSLFLQGESRDHTPDSVPLILPVRDHEEVQSAFQAHQSDLLQLKNPSSSGNAAEVENSHIASEQVGNAMQPKDANSETNSHDSNGTQCLNPFLMLSALPDEKPEHGLLALEHEVVQSSSEPFLSLSAGEDTVSKYEAVSSPKKLIHALSQSASEPGLRHTLENLEGEQGNTSDASVLPPRKVEDTASDPVSSPEQLIHTSQPALEPGLENTSESLEREHANPSDTSMLPPENIGEAASKYDPGSLLEKSISGLNQSAPEPEHGIPSNTYVPSPRKAEEPQNSLPSSLGESAWPSNPFALLASSELVQENRSSIVKLPRPRSPLIDAVAAHDKSKLRKVTERVRPQSEPKVDERNSLLEQIRTKSFNLKPAVVSRPSVQGPKTNLRVAAILEKANAIRQATAGSDEDDEDWSE